jgi:hypothetical protein
MAMGKKENGPDWRVEIPVGPIIIEELFALLGSGQEFGVASPLIHPNSPSQRT